MFFFKLTICDSAFTWLQSVLIWTSDEVGSSDLEAFQLWWWKAQKWTQFVKIEILMPGRRVTVPPDISNPKSYWKSIENTMEIPYETIGKGGFASVFCAPRFVYHLETFLKVLQAICEYFGQFKSHNRRWQILTRSWSVYTGHASFNASKNLRSMFLSDWYNTYPPPPPSPAVWEEGHGKLVFD